MQITLGELITGTCFRDAIHIAVAPVIANEELQPGQHIGFTPNTTEVVTASANNLIGIVDPFLHEPVKEGQRFWMLLYPNTIQNLRHEWSHPAFNSSVLEESIEWLGAFAKDVRLSFDEVIEYAKDADSGGFGYIEDGSEYARNRYFQNPSEFWKHIRIVTGDPTLGVDEPTPFSCSC